MLNRWDWAVETVRNIAGRYSVPSIVVAALLLFSAAGASGAEFVVDSTVDAIDAMPGDGICAAADGACTLRAAVIEANQFLGPDTISIPAGNYVLTIGGAPEDDSLAGDLDVHEDVSIQGAGALSTVIDAAGANAVISFHGEQFTTNVTDVTDMTITGATQDGLSISPDSANYGTNATVSDCIIEGNARAGILGPGNHSSTLSVFGTSIRDNHYGILSYHGGVIVENSQITRNDNGILNSGGGPIFGPTIVRSSIIEDSVFGISGSDMVLTVEDSIIRRNSGFGISFSDSSADVFRTTIEANGIGISGPDNVEGDALLLVDSLVANNATGLVLVRGGEIVNTTISGNIGGEVGGVALRYGGAVLRNCTIVGNSGLTAGGIGKIGSYPNAPSATVLGSIIADNHSASGPSDCGPLDGGASLILLDGGNLLGNSSGCAFTATADDQIGTPSNPIDPLLGPLASNGGMTPTHALLPGSPALDAAGDSCTSTDQRGVARPFDADSDGLAVCDIGAYEAADFDGDGIGDLIDNCLLFENSAQVDADGDGIGDACNDLTDTDGDEWADALDNCPAVANASQLDQDGDSLGDACDAFPLDPDNDQAQCESDLSVRSAELGICSADLDQCLTRLSTPEVLLETAAMGLEGEDFQHFGVNAQQFVGARFQVLAPTTTGSVGTHIVETFPVWGGSPGDLFAAIVRLTGPDDYPDSFDLSTPDVVGSALLPLPTPMNSTEVAVNLALPLSPGWYALLLGSGQLGATGGGAVTLNNPVIGSPSMFFGLPNSVSWQPDQGALLGARLFVRTESSDLLACEGDLSQCQMTLIEGNGDVNGDGVSDVLDSVMFRRWLAGYPNP